MTTQTIAPRDEASTIELALIEGDLSKLSPRERLDYYQRTCDSLGMNQFTKPFEYLRLNGRLILYAGKNAAEQLRDIHGVSITNLKHTQVGGLYVVTATAEDNEGRQDSEIGVVAIEGLRGDALANAMMKATTKAKRRVTLSLCGLGMLDESEVESIPTAQVVPHELSAEETKQLAAKYVAIHGSDDTDEQVKTLLMQNAQLLQEAKDAGVKLGELRRYSAQASWPIGTIEQANGALVEAIKSHNQDLDTQAAAQSGQRAFP